jgi:Domain of unknown function (DUF4124)
MGKFISLMLICCSANAAMYSCVDKNGTKVLQNFPCEQHEKQHEIVKVEKPSYIVINNTRERQRLISEEQEDKSNQSDAPSIATSDKYKQPPTDMKQSNWDKAMEWANQGVTSEQRDTRLGLALRVMKARGASFTQSDWDKAMEWANQGVTSEQRDTRSALVLRVLNGETAQPAIPASPLNPAATFSNSEPQPILAPQPSVITNCDSGGCWDDVGGRYDKGAGNTYFGPTGACQAIGGMMQCP